MNNYPRILLVDDTPENIDVLRATLSRIPDIQLNVAINGEKALELATRHSPDLILLDVMMPGMDGFEVCQKLRAMPEHLNTPVIFVTARTDDISKGFAAGGNDYIIKPINADEVLARVNHQIERLVLMRQLQSLNQSLESKVRERTSELAISNRQLREEVKERRYMQDRLQYLATHDFITHLYNRNALDDFVTETISLVQLKHTQGVFLQIDLDRFRLVNESCGCFAGDELLRQFADLVSGQMEKDDFFARLGGDKFALVCRGKNKESGLSLAKAIQRQFTDFDFMWDSRHFSLAATIALVSIDEDIISFDQLMMMADEVIYQLKKERRYLLSYDELNVAKNKDKTNVNWALRLMDALKNNHFRTHFQKITSLMGEQKGLKIEILVRLLDVHSQRLIYPDEFIPAAERFNLISQLDRWVFSNVIDFLTQNPGVISSFSSIAFNLSAISLREPEMADFIRQKISSSGISPNLFCFEITETEAIVNMEAARTFIQELIDFGCKFSLDDFGSGFSSFNYLRELPFNIVKIDGVFVRDMDRNPSHFAMVKSIVEVARQLEKEIVAEFVETETIATSLRALGVTWAQGYLYHRPEELSLTALG